MSILEDDAQKRIRDLFAKQTKPEPSRLEIAAMILSSCVSNNSNFKTHDDVGIAIKASLETADALIKANREMK